MADALGNLRHFPGERELISRLRELLAGSSIEQILEQIPSGVSIAEAPSGRLLLHNREATRLLRHPLLESEDYRGYAEYGALHRDGTPYRADEYPIARSILFGEEIQQHEMLYRRGDGSLTTLLVNAAPILDDGGAMVAAISTFQDISEQKATFDKLRADERRAVTAELIAGLAHEINNPLAAAVNALFLLPNVTAPQQEYIGVIRDAVDRVANVVREMVSLEHGTNGHPVVDVCSIAGHVCELMHARAEARHVRLSFTPNTVRPVTISATDAHNLLALVILNRIAAVNEGCEIDVSCDADDADLMIHVRDRGRAVAMDRSETISGAATRVRKELDEKIEVATATEIAAVCGGSIAIRVISGEGKVVTIRLPLAREAHSSISA